MSEFVSLFSKRVKGPFFASYILVVIFTLISGMFGFFLPLHLDNIGFTGFQIGVLFALAPLVSLLLEFGIGVFTDRVSIKKIVSLSFVFLGFYLLGFSIFTSFGAMLLVFVVKGAASSLFDISIDSFVLKKANSRKDRGSKLGIFQAFRYISLAIGIILGGVLLFILDFPIFMRFAALIIFLSMIFISLMPKNSKSVNKIKTYFSDYKSSPVVFFSIVMFLFAMHWGVEGVAYTLFLKEQFSLSLYQMGFFIGIPILFLGLSGFLFGKLRDKGFSMGLIFLIGFLFAGFGFIAMALTNNVYVAFIFRIIHEIGDGAVAIFLLERAGSYFPKKRIGGDYGLLHVLMMAGLMLGSVIYSPVGAAHGYYVPHLIHGVIIVFSVLLYPLTKKRE